jgi:SAM-dependent methyltransferase
LFPSLCVALGDGEQLPVRSGSVDGAFVNGVLSLHRQVRPMLAELRRCLGEAGRAAFTDIWSNEAGTFDDGPNRFWSLADIATELAEADLRVVHVVAAELSAGWWSQVAVDVDAEIDRRFAGRRGYDEWRADGDHLRRVAGSGRLMAAGLVVAVGRASGRSGQPSRS